jgi:molecular chaperone GrpE
VTEGERKEDRLGEKKDGRTRPADRATKGADGAAPPGSKAPVRDKGAGADAVTSDSGDGERDRPDDREAQEVVDAPVKDPLARAEEERAEYLALAQRAKADFENYRKRAAKDIAAAGARGRADVVRELLPVIDNLERALESAGDGEGALAQGVRLVHSELVALLERNGVESIEPAGEPFDPNLHEALSTRSENGAEAGVVLDVVQKGYRIDHAILRPARVVVSA